ncbi:MAG: hypothetical protein CHKLHMKO_00167 [Candidatus Argoarchaeum ethanivorans]|uniref:Uncharacterized protein n=1 Tax=Candidatus Argoarchaeum ethanivorans TaxID=2608793 RepID=A0A811T7L1_9EURY|nr:MAG: hypothetical protein CHKLHMKO_00167 [Candidatus Argoarchaeum ethanivorans]
MRSQESEITHAFLEMQKEFPFGGGMWTVT